MRVEQAAGLEAAVAEFELGHHDAAREADRGHILGHAHAAMALDGGLRDEAPGLVQAVGQMWTRIGVRTMVEAQPYATFIGRASRREAPAALLTWGNSTGEVSVLLNSVLRTPDRDAGHGPANRLLYSNAEMDRQLAAAQTEMDDARREDLLRRASLTALEDGMIVPLYLQNAIWAMRANLTYEARMDERNDPAAVRLIAARPAR